MTFAPAIDERDALSDASSIVNVEDVGFRYASGVVALQGASLSVKRGQILSIVGPSGCGKSTLLRLISGLTAPTSGKIVRDPSLLRNSALSMVFQGDTLLPWLTVAENAEIYAKFLPKSERRKGAEARKARTAELLGLVGLSNFAQAYPYQLSGGMRRRLAFTVAVAPSPRLLMLDEPFASVDEPTRIQIHQDILRIIRRLQMTVIIVTHDLAEALSLSDVVLIMTKAPGRIYRQHDVNFGAERDILNLRQSQNFLDQYGALWHDLSEQLKVTNNG